MFWVILKVFEEILKSLKVGTVRSTLDSNELILKSHFGDKFSELSSWLSLTLA